LVAVSVVGHRALYASARYCTPTVAAAVAPVSAVATALLGSVFDSPLPSLLQAVFALLWLALGAFVAVRADNSGRFV
jgi:hypothetical protein